MKMNIEQFKEYSKGYSKIIKNAGRDMIGLIVDDLAKKHNCSKGQAEYILGSALMYNVVREAINEQIDFLDDEHLIFETDKDEDNENQ